MAWRSILLLAIGIAAAQAVRPEGDDEAAASSSSKKGVERSQASASLIDVSASGSAELHVRASPGLQGAEEARARDADRLSLTSSVFEEALKHAATLVDMVTQAVAGHKSNTSAGAAENVSASAPSSLLSSQQRGGATDAACEVAKPTGDVKEAPDSMMQALAACVKHLEKLSEQTRQSAVASHKSNAEYAAQLQKAEGHLRKLEEEKLQATFKKNHNEAFCALHQKLCEIKEGYHALNGMSSPTLEECKQEKNEECSGGGDK